ncbi:MAG TPA: glucosaminidase domain-containing protein [Chitinophagaceae bacterium]|nr:glucosaminidase domain-containing protein [Chitinophagaceae bacterium]
MAGLLLAGLGRAQDPQTIQQYIDAYKDLAIREMIRTGVPASIKLAQGIHETQAGTSDLVRESNNHFGIKCKSTWTGESVTHDDDARGECFRKYPTAEDSYRDHSDFLKGSPRYASLFQLDPTDYRDWAWGLKKAGYATNPKYAQILIQLIEQYHLNDYTLIALGRLRGDSADLAAAGKPVPDQPASDVAGKGHSGIPQDSTVQPVESRYPEGEFRINATRVVFVRQGTPFLTIASQYQIPLARLFEFNDMDPAEAAAKDQLIYLQRKRKTGDHDIHVVQPGETLYDIAQAEAVRLQSLLEYNRLHTGQQPAVGETLYLQHASPAAPRLALRTDYSIYDASKMNLNK